MNTKFENRFIYVLYGSKVLVVPNISGRWAYFGTLAEVGKGVIMLTDATIIMDISQMIPESCTLRRQVVIDADCVESIILPAVV